MAKKQEGMADVPTYAPRKGFTLGTPSNDIEELGRIYAAHFTSAPFAALRVIMGAEHGKGGYGHDIDVPALLASLREQGEAVNAGSLTQAEAMLMNQATALQRLFSRLAARAMGWDELAPFEAYMRMALRAQSQCRATLETLAAIKNPSSIAFVRQANIGQAVQVNNGTLAPGSRAGKSENPQSQLLEADHGERLDTGKAGAAIGADQLLATVAAINGAEVGRG